MDFKAALRLWRRRDVSVILTLPGRVIGCPKPLSHTEVTSCYLTPMLGAQTHPSGIPTSAGRLIPEVGQVPELPALEEALPHVLDVPLDVGLVPEVTHPCGIGDEAPVLGVFKEAMCQLGVQRVGAHHCGWEVVVQGGRITQIHRLN